MIEYPKQPHRFVHFIPKWVLLWMFFAWSLPCQMNAAALIQVSYGGKLYPIMDVKRMYPVISVDGKRKTIKKAQYNFQPTGGVAYGNGYFEMRNRLFSTGGTRFIDTGDVVNRTFEFSAEIKTSADAENCFIGIEIRPDNMAPGILVYEMPSFKAGKWRKVNFQVAITVPLGEGQASEYLFTNGQQILSEPAYNQWKRKSLAVAVAGDKKTNTAPMAINSFRPGFPEALKGVIEHGSVLLEFAIGTNGEAHGIKVVESSHELLDSPAVESIQKTRFFPATRDGVPVETVVRQKITFTDP